MGRLDRWSGDASPEYICIFDFTLDLKSKKKRSSCAALNSSYEISCSDDDHGRGTEDDVCDEWKRSFCASAYARA